MKIWLICEKIDGGELKPVGVFSDTETVLKVLVDGVYLGIPLELDKLYTANIISEGMPGTTTHVAKATDVSNNLKAALDTLTSLDGYVRNTIVPAVTPLVTADIPEQLTDLSNRITALVAPVQTDIPAQLTALADRITALEGT